MSAGSKTMRWSDERGGGTTTDIVWFMYFIFSIIWHNILQYIFISSQIEYYFSKLVLKMLVVLLKGHVLKLSKITISSVSHSIILINM